MSPAKRRRLPPAGAAAAVGFSPFLRSLSRLPPPKAPSSSAAAPPREPSAAASLGRRRRRPREDEDPTSSDGDEEEEEEEEESYAEESVQVDFGFFDPKPGDFHGVKLLLRTYLDDRVWDLSGFVDVVLQQTTVGTVVKSDNDEDGGEGLYAVISALNLDRYANLKCIKDFKDYVLGVCPRDLQEEWRSLLVDRARDVALLVCERFVNYPDQAVPPLYNGLFDEIEWATEDEPTQEIRDYFHFKFYLFVTKLYVKKSASKKQVDSNGGDSNQSIVYIKSEDEIFRKMSSISFTFDIHYGHVVPHEMKGYKKMGLAMVVKSDHVPAIRQEINLLGS